MSPLLCLSIVQHDIHALKYTGFMNNISTQCFINKYINNMLCSYHIPPLSLFILWVLFWSISSSIYYHEKSTQCCFLRHYSFLIMHCSSYSALSNNSYCASYKSVIPGFGTPRKVSSGQFSVENGRQPRSRKWEISFLIVNS